MILDTSSSLSASTYISLRFYIRLSSKYCSRTPFEYDLCLTNKDSDPRNARFVVAICLIQDHYFHSPFFRLYQRSRSPLGKHRTGRQSALEGTIILAGSPMSPHKCAPTLCIGFPIIPVPLNDQYRLPQQLQHVNILFVTRSALCCHDNRSNYLPSYGFRAGPIYQLKHALATHSLNSLVSMTNSGRCHIPLQTKHGAISVSSNQSFEINLIWKCIVRLMASVCTTNSHNCSSLMPSRLQP